MTSNNTNVTEAVILAGGLGTRLRSVVQDLPKPMAPVAGRPFLEYQLDHLIAQGIRRVVLSVGYLNEKIQQHFGDHYKTLDISYAVEDEPLGTGGGFLKAAAMCDLNQPLLVLNGDTWFPVNIDAMAREHNFDEADVTIALRKASSAGRYGGIVLDADNRVVSFQASGQVSSQWINGGVYLFSGPIIKQWLQRAGQRLSLEQDMLEAGVKSGIECYGFPSDCPFIDIGVPEDYAKAADVIDSKVTVE